MTPRQSPFFERYQKNIIVMVVWYVDHTLTHTLTHRHIDMPALITIMFAHYWVLFDRLQGEMQSNGF